MRAVWCLILGLLLVGQAACHQKSNWPVTSAYHQNQLRILQEQRVAADRENQRLRQSSGSLDGDMQELERLLASARQEVQIVQSNLGADRKRLKETAEQLAAARGENEGLKRKYEDLVASTRRQGGAIITANSSLGSSVPSIDIPGVTVAAEDDVVRCRIPGELLFEPGTERLSPTGANLLDRVTAALLSAYPKKIIGVEGHSGRAPGESLTPPAYEASVSRAMAVFKHLAGDDKVGAERLFVTGHGPNHPAFSNGTDKGRRGNNRVELVVYPDTAGPI